jgi:perosamine synthetase
MSRFRLPVSQPALLGREAEYVQDCMSRNELSSVGSYVQRLEAAFAEFCGTKYAIACSSGTAALHLAMLALGLKRGDRVIVPALTYVATANAVSYCGAQPVFCDVNRDTWCLDTSDVLRALTRDRDHDIVGIIPVHLYGTPCDMAYFRGMAEHYRVWLVEDAAEAHGARLNGQRLGSLGDLGVFSFYGNKIIACGEGGMVTTNDPHLNELVRLYRGQGVEARGHYNHKVIGYNYRLTNIQAAIALGQLEMYEEHAKARRQIADWYDSYLPAEYKQQKHVDRDRADWLVTVLVPSDLAEVVEVMTQAGIETRPVFIPLTQLAMYKQQTPPNTAEIAARGLSLPTWVGMTEADVQFVTSTLRSVLV